MASHVSGVCHEACKERIMNRKRIKAMIITAVAVGTRGDVNPLADLGGEMIKRGHEFRILTSEAFRPLIEKKGVVFLKLDTDADHVMKYLVTDYKTDFDFMRGMFRLK